MALWGKIVSWVTGGAVTSIGEQLNVAYKNRLKAQTDEAKLEADQVINQLQARVAAQAKDSENPITRWIRPGLAFPFVVYLWDRVLGLGFLPPLSPELYPILNSIIGFYFLGRSAEKIVKTLKHG